MWVLLALVAAVCNALRDVASKHAVRQADPIVVALGIAAVPALVLGGVVMAMGPAPPAPGFWTALLISGGINALATPLIVLALQRSDLSLVTPLTSLTPLFMIATGAIVLGELPGPAGMLGVATIAAGAYLLALPHGRVGALGPIRALLHDPGARVMLVVAFLYSISATYDKVGVQASSPLFWAAAVHLLVTLILAPLAWRRFRRPATAPAPRAILLAGALATLMAAAQMTAIVLTLAAYVIAVKRTSTLFGVLFGRSFFGEGHTRQRLAAAGIMLAGFLLVTLG